MTMIDDVDIDLLMRLQYGFRLTPTPFQQMADDMGVEEQVVLGRVRKHLENGTVVRIGARLAHSALAEAHTALVGLKVAPGSVKQVARTINGLGGVKHNYLRDCDEFNVWFTVRTASGEALREKISSVTSHPGVLGSALLPTKDVHKLDVKFDLRRGTSWSSPTTGQKTPPGPLLSPKENEALDSLAGGIAPIQRPLEPIARALGQPEEYIVGLVDDCARRGIVKDVAATLCSDKIGFSENAMVVIRVPLAEAPKTCKRIVHEFPEITHCVERVCPGNWPYPCYAMVHGRGRERLCELADAIGRAAGASEIRAIFSSRNLGGIR